MVSSGSFVAASDMPAGTPNRLDMRIGCYILYGLCTTAVILRLNKLSVYARTIYNKTMGFDDIMVIAAWVTISTPLSDLANSIPYQLTETIVIAGIKIMFDHGVGWHVADIMTLENAQAVIARMILWPWVGQILYFFGLGCIKGSIVALYLRLAVTQRQRYILWGVLAFILTQSLTSTIVVAAFFCSPLSQVWTDPTAIGGPTCIAVLPFNYYNAGLFVVTDIFLATAPLVVIKDLYMDKEKKYSLCIMFSLGLLAIGGTISRQVTNAIAIENTQDFTWLWAPAALCSVLESSLGIIFVCVPAMAPLFSRFIGGSTERYVQTPDRPGTFGKIGENLNPKLRPTDESILCVTQVTAVDPMDRGADLERGGAYEMDERSGDQKFTTGDDGSEKTFIIQAKQGQNIERAMKGMSFSGGKGKVVNVGGNSGDGKGGVWVDTRYDVQREVRKSLVK
ncbi:hypothetical protein HYFRA_00007273 [Hymenoscyphus fraxineus]|uniref:Rhodopsin domain-containing protein n=1 Tax=Hymenoscyphus fraxineus TaxID=746836 RepID=A0A9N9KST0_9HELO|nr:hypothetical protein HYFRA_00007273 [Hymenoscyphus fraxineus]